VNEKTAEKSAKGVLRLDWSRMLGFDQVGQGARAREHARKHVRLAKVGAKTGAKPGLKVVRP
jgi:hypothetical protein